MSKPTPGQQYTIKSGDTLSSLASQAYGDPTKTANIEGANQSEFKSDTGDLLTGAVIVIPVLPEDQSVLNQFTKERTTLDPDEFALFIAGREVVPSSARIFRSMDTAADGWTAVIPWNPRDNFDLDDRIAPYAYPRAQAFIGKQRLVNGLLYTVSPSMTESGRFKTLEGWSYTVDAVDSTIKPPYERKNITLEQRAEELLTPLGIRAVFENEAGVTTETGGPFSKMTSSKTDTIFSHLAKYASQRGVLISSTVDGDMSFIRANTDGKPVGTIEETTAFSVNWTARFDGRKRFSAYKAVGQSPKKNDKTAIATDDNVPLSRFTTFSVNDTTEGDIQTAANWRRSKQLAESLTMPFNVSTLYAPDGTLWRENTLVTVISETLSILFGFTFLIKSVEYIVAPEGISANLSLVPPQVYTGDPVEIPWRPFVG